MKRGPPLVAALLVVAGVAFGVWRAGSEETAEDAAVAPVGSSFRDGAATGHAPRLPRARPRAGDGADTIAEARTARAEAPDGDASRSWDVVPTSLLSSDSTPSLAAGPDATRKTVRARLVTAAGPAKGVYVEGAVSDAEGRVTFSIPRSYRGFLIARHHDGTTFRVSVPQDDEAEADLGELTIVPPGPIAGVVVDETDRPVAGAAVALLSAELDCRTVGTATTDAQGRFEIPRVGHGAHEVVARAKAPPDVDAPEFGGRVQGLLAGATDVRVVARRMFAVVLRLRDEDGKEPVSGPWIASELHREGEPADRRMHELRHRTNEVTWLVDVPGRYDVTVRMFDDKLRRRDGHVFRIEFGPGRENALDLTMKFVQ